MRGVRFFLSILAATTLSACADGASKDETADTDAAGGTDAANDTDAANNTDAANDTDVSGDTDVASDTDGAADWSGQYAGDFTVSVTVPSFSNTDNCVGTGTVGVNPGPNATVTLTVTCAFAGTLSEYISGNQSVSGQGATNSSNGASGNLTLLGVQSAWTGTFAGSPAVFTMPFSGSGTYAEQAVTFSGTFTGTRAE